MINKKYKILCAGGAGFIGSNLTDKLLELGHDVTVVDDFSTGSYSNLENATKSKNFRSIKLDISSKNAETDLVEICQGIDYIFHLAAIPRTQYCVENPVACNQANVTGTINLLEAARKNKVKKVILSASCAAYGPGHDDEEVVETASINLGTPYAAQKYMQELYTKLYTDLYSLPSVILRYFNVYGTKRQAEAGTYPNVIAAFNKAKKTDGKIYVTGTGEQSRDMVHVYDVVDANIAAMESEIGNGEVFNVGTGSAVTVNEVAKYFDCPIEYIPARPGEAFRLCANITKVNSLLKWKAKIPFSEGINIYLSQLN